jgi:hypothetical protein
MALGIDVDVGRHKANCKRRGDAENLGSAAGDGGDMAGSAGRSAGVRPREENARW